MVADRCWEAVVPVVPIGCHGRGALAEWSWWRVRARMPMIWLAATTLALAPSAMTRLDTLTPNRKRGQYFVGPPAGVLLEAQAGTESVCSVPLQRS